MDIPMAQGMSMARERLSQLLNLKLIPRLIPICCMADSMVDTLVIVVTMDIPMAQGMSMERERLSQLLNLKLIPRLILICCMVDIMVSDTMDMALDTMDMVLEDTTLASKGRGTTKFTLLFEQ